jgi:hypothetical protein
MGWWKEAKLVEVDQLVEVFRTSDQREGPRKVRTLPGPLDWRTVARYVARSMRVSIYDEFASTDVKGVKAWQREIIVASISPGGDLARFLRELPEPDAELLRRRFGGLLTEDALLTLPSLAEAVVGARLLGRSLKELAAAVGIKSPRDLYKLTRAVEAYQKARIGDRVVRQYRRATTVTGEVFIRLIKAPTPATAERRAELFALWLRTDPRPMAPHMGNLCELPVLEWLLKGNAEPMFRLMVGKHRKELESFTDWFLRLALPHVERFTDKRPLHGYVENTFGVMYHGAWAWLAEDVEEAALANGIPVSHDARLPKMTRVAPRNG